jgi:hypothetical protein
MAVSERSSNKIEGRLIKSRSNPAIYVVERGQRRWIPDAPTLASKGDWSAVEIVSEADAERIPLGSPYPTVIRPQQRPDGALISAGEHLFVIKDQKRCLVPDPATLFENGYDPSAVEYISEPEINAIPLGPDVTRPRPRAARALTHDVDFYVDSFLGAGHYMRTGGTLRTSGRVECNTRTTTITWFGGFRGGVSLLFYDAGGKPTGSTQNPVVRTFGVDGTLIGRSDRTDYWSEDISPDVVSRTTMVLVMHSWAPNSLADQIRKATEIGQAVEPFIQTIASIAKAVKVFAPIS